MDSEKNSDKLRTGQGRETAATAGAPSGNGFPRRRNGNFSGAGNNGASGSNGNPGNGNNGNNGNSGNSGNPGNNGGPVNEENGGSGAPANNGGRSGGGFRDRSAGRRNNRRSPFRGNGGRSSDNGGKPSDNGGRPSDNGGQPGENTEKLAEISEKPVGNADKSLEASGNPGRLFGGKPGAASGKASASGDPPTESAEASAGSADGAEEPGAERRRSQRNRRRSERKQPPVSDVEKPEEPVVPEEPVTLCEVIGVRFKQGGKVYYFDPNGMTFHRDDAVIVDTARGIEYGIVSASNRTVPLKEVVLPLRKAIRAATEEDGRRKEAVLERETEAFNLCLSKIEEHRLDMKLVDVEASFDNSKILFYFTSEGRVDFRDLVKDLAAVFRTRIELRQIGIRDEAKLMGGLGICGRPFCCSRFLSDFAQVSIKMAKEQNLSLNSAKISGACGRLMCCLRYEHDVYTEEIAKTPKVNSLVSTPDGDGVVTEVTPLVGLCKVTLDKDPAASRVYHRDDLKVKGMKGKRRPEEPPSEKEEASRQGKKE